MRKNIVSYFLISLLLPAFCFAQATFSIEGRVVDSQTKEPLEFANVYLSQTTFGAATNEKGSYKIGKLPAGRYILVASLVGYEPKTINVSLNSVQNIVADFSLNKSLYQFGQIEVRGEIPKEWFDHLEIFKKALFGNNEFAGKCDITNPYQIDFKEENSILTAAAKEPIVIVNLALGYRIECVLKSFSYDLMGRTSGYQIYPSFSEIDSSDSAKEFESNRREAYLGSLAQLLSSLAVNNYKFRDDGFELHVANRLVARANEIVQVDSLNNKYFLHAKECITIKYWNFGKRYTSKLCLQTGITEFDPSGFLINPNEFIVSGDLSREGVATMLPRFWKLPEDRK